MSQKNKFIIKIIHGPNLNLLGKRETSIYGTSTLATINASLKSQAKKLGALATCFQSNHEGELIDCIQKNASADGFIINPAAYTHTSIALRDALLAVNIPFVEVHLSDINKREKFRQFSYFSDVAIGVVKGLGAKSYTVGLEMLVKHLKTI